MNDEKTEIGRKALYELVWTTPMQLLARGYGISNVGLAKICRKHGIPRPPRGYWAKKRHGPAPARPALPDPERVATIIIHKSQPSGPVKKTHAEEEICVEVPKTLAGAHHLVRQTESTLKIRTPDSSGLLTSPQGQCLAVRVSPKALHRSLCIMEAVIRSAESRGFVITASDGATAASKSDVKIAFRLTEEVETIKEEPAAPPLEGRYVFGHSRIIEKVIPTGRLHLRIDSHSLCYGSSIRHNWRDTEKRPLDGLLGDFIVALSQLVEVECQRRIERQRQAEEWRKQEREREAAERRRAERERAIRAEQGRVDQLLKEAEQWAQSIQLSQYIEARTREQGAVRPGSEFAAWRQWALQQVDRLNPLKGSPPSTLDSQPSPKGVDSETYVPGSR